MMNAYHGCVMDESSNVIKNAVIIKAPPIDMIFCVRNIRECSDESDGCCDFNCVDGFPFRSLQPLVSRCARAHTVNVVC